MEYPSAVNNLSVLLQLHHDRPYMIIHIDTIAWHAKVISNDDDYVVLQPEGLTADRAYFIKRLEGRKKVVPKAASGPDDELHVYLKSDVPFGNEMKIYPEDILGFRFYTVKERPGMLGVFLASSGLVVFFAPPALAIALFGGMIAATAMYQFAK